MGLDGKASLYTTPILIPTMEILQRLEIFSAPGVVLSIAGGNSQFTLMPLSPFWTLLVNTKVSKTNNQPLCAPGDNYFPSGLVLS